MVPYMKALKPSVLLLALLWLVCAGTWAFVLYMATVVSSTVLNTLQQIVDLAQMG